jgi:hypothetical protein
VSVGPRARASAGTAPRTFFQSTAAFSTKAFVGRCAKEPPMAALPAAAFRARTALPLSACTWMQKLRTSSYESSPRLCLSMKALATFMMSSPSFQHSCSEREPPLGASSVTVCV